MKKFLTLALISLSTLLCAMQESSSNNPPVWPITPAIAGIYGHLQELLKEREDQVLYPCIEKVAFEKGTKEIYKIILVKDNNRIGSVTFSISNAKKPFYKVYIDKLFIEKSQRGKGFGSFLMKHLLSLFSKLAYSKKVTILFYLLSAEIDPEAERSAERNILRNQFYLKLGLGKYPAKAQLESKVLYFGTIFKGAEGPCEIPEKYKGYNYPVKSLCKKEELPKTESFFLLLETLITPLFELSSLPQIYNPVKVKISYGQNNYPINIRVSTYGENVLSDQNKNPSKNTKLTLLSAFSMFGEWKMVTPWSDNKYEQIVQKTFANLVMKK